jgi:hypothetical protein
MTSSYTKDPDALLDYVWGWGKWLDDGDTIISHTVTASPGLTVDSSSTNADGKSVTVWLRGGVLGQSYEVTVHIVTVGGREDDRTRTFLIRNR